MDDDFACSAASVLYPYGVACVSRLIGKFDSTGKVILWQVGVWGRTALSNKPRELEVWGRKHPRRHCKRAQMHETPLFLEWRATGESWPCAGHWPPSELRRERSAHLQFQAARLADPLFEGRSLAVALPGTRCCQGSLASFYERPHITGPDDVAIVVPFAHYLFTITYVLAGVQIVLILEVKRRRFFKKA